MPAFGFFIGDARRRLGTIDGICRQGAVDGEEQVVRNAVHNPDMTRCHYEDVVFAMRHAD